MTPIELLRAAQAKIAAGWCQGDYATDNTGRWAKANDPEASCFCMIGALASCLYLANDDEIYDADEDTKDVFLEANKALLKVTGVEYLANWNDAEGRTQAEVVNAFENAIVQLEIRG